MIICRSLALLIIFSFYSYSIGNEQVVMVLDFAGDELNRNSDLLPNLSIVYKTARGCMKQSQFSNQFTTGSAYYTAHSYYCNQMSSCFWILSGPNWAISAKYGKLLDFLLLHKVRFCRICLGKIYSVCAIPR